ncbi:uncharacterized protein M421DRAFT_5098 [Didymella exigua CBS 183.55]|uniref:Uncharacterized protein n=1 Tax=Didymella exigua CBS 183.55 TaxID=1150837 RepID=A0A6A5RTD8_9PLEO|nr:uncharacterized protein M421DRAFT_5098 [Didymella exigua CBS 183.55]KAF1928637.1 hypothetical protein M421DRAFT_5098 [Didymella exigua CBS 183.55]
MHALPPTMLILLFLALTSTCASTPAPPLLGSDYAISLMPRHTLFYRQTADLQTFTAALGGVRASPITKSGIPDRPFSVGGNSFPDFASAAQRSCDEQFQGCQQLANAKGGGGGGGAKDKDKGNGKQEGKKGANGDVTVDMCGAQKDKCSQAQQTATVKDFKTPVASMNIGPDPLFPDYDLICEG